MIEHDTSFMALFRGRDAIRFELLLLERVERGEVIDAVFRGWVRVDAAHSKLEITRKGREHLAKLADRDVVVVTSNNTEISNETSVHLVPEL
jgi:hypothetical protein